ncbi:MAG: hypothetical protein HY240_05605 [Actinobacteria bacterium]|nr:hypothetical protein [Actinomycetota bacterium]
MEGSPGPASPASLARRARPLAGVVAVILVVVLGGYVVAAALSEPAGPPVGFNGIARVRPLSGWQDAGFGHGTLDVGGRPLPLAFVVLTRGNGNLSISAVPGAGVAPGALADAFVADALGGQLDRLSVSRRPEQVTLASGVPAVRLGFVGVRHDTGASVEGEVTALATPGGDGVVFVASAPAGLFRFIQGDVHAMEDDVELFA